MKDYHVLSLDNIGAKVTDNGVALDIKDVPWAGRQMWAPDAAFKNGIYYLYFPAKDKQDVFGIGVATSKSPTGPFKAEPQPIEGSYSIDPSVFTDTDGKSYIVFGGIWGRAVATMGNRFIRCEWIEDRSKERRRAGYRPENGNDVERHVTLRRSGERITNT